MDGDEEKPKHPLTGETYDEKAERARLVSSDEISATSPELQQKFQNFVDQFLVPDIAHKDFSHKTVPARLFFAREVKPTSKPSNTRRVYFKRDDRLPTYNFRPAHELNFEKSQSLSGEIINFRVHSLGEEHDAPYEELDSFTISCDLNTFGDESLNIQSNINSKVLRVSYWQGGKLDVIEFNSDLRKHHSDDVDLTAEIFEAVKAKKSKEVVQARGADFEVTYNEESDAVEIRRILKGKQTDFMSIPMQVDLKQTQVKVLSGQLIDNPVGADLSEDDQWMALTLNDLGINWQRS